MLRMEVKKMAQILVVEDEPKIREILVEFLREYGYIVDCASDGLEGINSFNTNNYDLIILDVMMPKVDGFAVLELIRKTCDIPVILLTALESEMEQMKGFDLGVDDYITKPFSMNLLIRRVEAVLRRKNTTESEETVDSQVVKYKNVSLDTAGCEVMLDGCHVDFTYKEFELLKLLMMNPNRVFSREMLLNQVWGYDFFGNDRVVNNHMMRIRQKLGENFIVTVRGVGYKLGK